MPEDKHLPQKIYICGGLKQVLFHVKIVLVDRIEILVLGFVVNVQVALTRFRGQQTLLGDCWNFASLQHVYL